MITRRQKRVSSLIKEELSHFLIEDVQDSFSGLITITRVEMSNDLRTAHVYISFYGKEKKENIMQVLERRKGYLRKSIASKVKLKYNPKLIFSLDRTSEYEEKLEELIRAAKRK